jgi:hypothetical protein
MLNLPDQDVLQLTVERHAQTGKRFQIDMASCSRIETVDEIFGNTRFFGQFARGSALAGLGLMFPE